MTNRSQYADAAVSFVALSLEVRMRTAMGESIDDGLRSVHQTHERRLEACRDEGGGDFVAGLGLSMASASALLLLVAAAVDPIARHRISKLTGMSSGVPAHLLRDLAFEGEPTPVALRELSASGVLRRLQLIERCDQRGADAHDDSVCWAVAPRVLAAIYGDDTLDARLRGIAELGRLSDPSVKLAGADEAKPRAVQAVRAGCIVVCSGAPGSGRRSMFTCVADQLGCEVLWIDARRLAKDHAALGVQLKLLARECKLLGRAPLIRNIDALVDGADASRVDLVGSELVAELDGPVFVTCGPQRPAIRWGRPTVVVEMKPPTSAQRAQLWLRELGQGTQEDAEYLATQFPLAPALIHHAGAAAKARANGQPLQPDDIYQGVRAVLDDRLGDYARRVEVTQTWDDLVLPEDQREAVQYLVARIRQRRTVYEQWGFAAKVGKGLGTSALFSGPPGTGKTMVAALVAKELGLELYQVDMAKVVSKFIGETERNLAALFDAAEAGHAVLLFDEADSLFGKRTEVKSSNDRYANLETNYLLQRLESFTGICLLTSNHEANIDPAFQRRLSLHVRFELPEVEERAALWRAMLPAAAPVEASADFDKLARRFVMSGGYIRNAALRAAFLAAEEASAITGAHLERAARLEMEAMGRIAST